MKLYDERIEAYATRHTEEVPPSLTQLYQHTYAKIPMPQMMVGHLQGRLLAAFSHMIRPKSILEIGTYTGYSALCLAEGLQPGGLLHTIDKNESLAEMARRYFQLASMTDQIQCHIGSAAAILATLDASFDLVFIDADKRNYGLYYELVLEKTRPGGFILVDNVLWGGRVLDGDLTCLDKRTQAMVDFNTKVHRDTRVANILLPIRDGLMILRKK